jgi:(1->4)-alpha-D-glucan 1-alpha-D-glucosylmutase
MIPNATYRLQLTKEFGFEAAGRIAPYLQALGVSHVYCSPYLKARPGSQHGYDIVDHGELNPELGDELAFRYFTAALKAHGLQQILDFVPNHMGVFGADNPLWLETLEWGPDAPHAGWFDIEWDPERRYLHDKVLVPLLGDQYGIELERGVLRLRFDPEQGSFAVWAYETHKLPIWPPHYAQILSAGPGELENLADAFEWLPTWRGQMPQRAAELKAQLASLASAGESGRQALQVALARFEGSEGDAASWQPLHQLIQQQHWRVAHFRVAADDINYRRFFNINDLAGLRMELPEVFNQAHRRVLELVKDGTLDGLRIDHVDGLRDPKAYLRRLQRRVAACRRVGDPFYLVVEKILSSHESLREDWPIDGTTGYDYLNQLLSILIDPNAEQAFSSTYRDFSGERRPFGEIVRLCKLHIMENEMASELNMRARDMARLARENPRTADFTQNLLRRAIKELIACFPVYRTYMDTHGTLDSADQRDLSWALSAARRNETEIDPTVFDFLEQVLSGQLLARARSGFSRQALLRCVMRLQQYTGPVVAKALEDTAFYRYNRFVALNEVGGDPDHFGGAVGAFHRANQHRAQHWPHSMLTTGTHDTKRGADARARLAALSEFPSEWAQQLPIWSRILRGPAEASEGESSERPDRNSEYLLYQQLLCSWPCECLQLESADSQELRAYAERVRAAMTKSIREARQYTNWAFPNGEYEQSVAALVDTALLSARATMFLQAFLPLARRVAALAVHNSLIQTVITLTAPGVPDLYNGAELWDLSMVDPDNRRQIDYELRSRLLAEVREQLASDRPARMQHWLQQWQDGRIKLATICTLLEHRAAHAELYSSGDYQPLQTTGERADELCSYSRTLRDQVVLVAAARFPRRRESGGFDARTAIVLPAALRSTAWRELLTGEAMPCSGDGIAASSLFARLPVAVLLPGSGSAAG